ncbi:MAG TPA: EAL domain-containing protein [Pyrinomonadaceae bacterium]|nr:EAL domain-containing protein [Acidobacteriota bacterium]HQZ95089.1 EAL domain-containing protein [Pyrinomonadaceae bacterium]
MLSKERSINIFIALLTPIAIAAVVWALRGISGDQIDSGVITLAVLTVFCSCYLRIQLPRVNIHVTISDGLVILAMLLYGGEIALLIAVIETTLASLNILRQGVSIKPKTIVLNSYFAAIAVFAASKVISFIFLPVELIRQRNEPTAIIWLVAVMALSMFLVNSIFVALFSSLKKERSFWKVWTENCFSAVMIYLTGAVVAGVMYITLSIEQVNITIIAAVIGFFGIIYLTFRRFVEDVKKTVEKAKQAERERAEQAEQHVGELQHYVAELERSGEALQESHENFRHAAYHDALTGLPNRNFFMDTLKGLLQQSRENSEVNFAVLFLDLKSFKTINDSLGHSMGDRLIKNVAKRLSGLVREEDMTARFSGDKFGIILTDLLSREEATAFADRLARRLAEPYTLDGRQVFTSAKIGIAYGNSKYPEAEDILRDADIAMYYAKDNEENYVIFDQKMHIRAVTRLQLETDLRFAIERNEFELYYQPIISLDTAALSGFEALVRWNHPQRGLVPPNEFIPISESTGLIIPMTVQILHAACSQVVKWQSRSNLSEPLSIAVNLSGKHFGHPALVEQIQTVIAETGINPESLKLELTESAVMDNAETAILMLKQIKETGVRVSIDDFGTGYSSLSYLHRFPIDLLKVDRSFVSAMEENTENGEIVRTVIALAKALKLKVVAEGIESIHQFHQLSILGCEYGQGYLFSKPLPVADIERLLADNNRWQNILPSTGMPVMPPGRDIAHLRLAQ